MINWIKHKLGIDILEDQVSYLSGLERFELADVASKLEESMVVIAGDGMHLQDITMIVPNEKKTGLLFLGNNCSVTGGFFRSQRKKVITEYLEEVK